MTLQQTVRLPQVETAGPTAREYLITWLLASFLALHGGAVAEMLIGGTVGSLLRSVLWFVAVPGIVMYTIRHSSERRW